MVVRRLAVPGSLYGSGVLGESRRWRDETDIIVEDLEN